jgi:alpha-galactosidase
MAGMISTDSQLLFHLRNSHFSYAMQVLDGRFLAHLYWGPPLRYLDPRTLLRPRRAPYLTTISLGENVGTASAKGFGRPYAGAPGSGNNASGASGLDEENAIDGPEADRGEAFSLDLLPQEYPAWGTGEQREGAFRVIYTDGSEAARLEYLEHEVYEGSRQPELLGLIREEHDLGKIETLRVRLGDPRGDMVVDLFYLVAEKSALLLRWARFTNTGTGALTLGDPSSGALDLPAGSYDLVRLGGAWGRERHILRTALAFGRHAVGSRGGATGHQSSPFMAICDPEATEEAGRVYAISLGYSGNYQAVCDVDQYDVPRLTLGINRFRGHLEPAESFETPMALLAHSEAGFGGVSHAFHQFARSAVVAGRRRDEPRKVIINSWEAMYFQVNAEKVIALAKEGKAIGAELLVLDDGWFSGRRDDTTSLGDWWPNEARFPHGLGPVAQAVRGEGLEFGLWIEPEMVSPESELYKRHPDWALQISGRENTLARSQLILDLSNPEVGEHLFGIISAVLRESGATYVKWDMNRNMSEAGSPVHAAERQGEVMHRYILGLYKLLGRLTEAFPEVLFEGCAGGGGRFDFGLMRFSPRFWTSDQSDAVERLEIQYGTTMLFPPEVIGSHVSSVPNHQVGRTTPAQTRVLTALPFSFGFELDPRKEPEEDLQVFRSGAMRYRQLRERFGRATFTRLLGPLSGGSPLRRIEGGGGGETAWMLATERELFVFYFRPLERANYEPRRLRLPSLADGAIYRDRETGLLYDGALLRSRGLTVEPGFGDYQARFWHLERQVEGV